MIKGERNMNFELHGRYLQHHTNQSLVKESFIEKEAKTHKLPPNYCITTIPYQKKRFKSYFFN
jgi:hypothetical protein